MGIEYETTLGDPLVESNDENVPCTVCGVQTSAVFMQPGVRSCPGGWNVQYIGYIMSELEGAIGAGRASENYRSSFVCVDESGDVVDADFVNLSSPHIEAKLTHVRVDCSATDILPCNAGGESYIEGQLSCAVCSKTP